MSGKGTALNRSIWFTLTVNGRRSPISIDLPEDRSIPLSAALQAAIGELTQIPSAGLSSVKMEFRTTRPTAASHAAGGTVGADSLMALLQQSEEAGEVDMEVEDESEEPQPDPEGLRIAMARQEERARILNQKGNRK